ncbi:hypothetical protein NQ314_016638 [Rhamnusium bicolor]|uniref:Coiled-coil domain-containing protein 40 n=1 Tax=Rhamnusium bicolor TaxID=1586634 RepID=A0AAV8WVG1_9CUCU|nr:hypothetical protein NQ314_016638 [Rhamnusium bicolor]
MEEPTENNIKINNYVQCTVDVEITNSETTSMESTDSVNIEKCSLSPDHPLLEKFQKALKEHLLFQIARVKDEIFENESETKMKNAEREQLGVQTYEAQQMVCKQQKDLENLIVELQNVTSAKDEVEYVLEKKKQKQKELRDQYFMVENSNRELQSEIEAINFLIRQMSEWEKKLEGEITVNQRVAEKTRKDHLQFSEEKKAQDLLIYKLTTEIWKLESEMETISIQMRVKSTEMEELEQSVALGNTNIEALEAEYRCLMHSWNSVIVAITNRDKSLECLNEEINRLQEKLKSTTAEIEQVKKLTKQELIENEKQTLIKDRFELDIKNCKTQTDDEMRKTDSIERMMFDLQAIVEQTEKDIESTAMENHNKETILNIISKEFDKVSSRKFVLEEKFVKDLQNQMANDKAASSLNKMLSSIREKKKDVEIILNEAENKSSQLSTEIESQKYSNDENKRLLQEILKQQGELEKEADHLQDEKKKYEFLFRKRERQADVLNSKLEKVIGGKLGQPTMSRQEVRIIELERHIEEIQENVKKLQSFWLREQKNLLVVSKERQEQIHNINLLKKQTLILEQKNLRISDEIDAYKRAEEKVMQNINNLQNRAALLCDILFKKRNQKTSLDKSNTLLQSEYYCKLKDSELACLQIEASITEIEEDKVNLSKEIIEVNRESLEWDKKLQLARETMNNIREERSAGGEVENMKQEIHRMNVIYSQLKRAQEKLIKDLEHCVSRRESIYTVSEARQKKQKVCQFI